MVRVYHYILLLLLGVTSARAQSVTPVIINNSNEIVTVDAGIEFLKDIDHNFSLQDVFHSNNFKKGPRGIPNENITSSAFWFRFKVRNESDLPGLVLKIAYPELDSIDYYEQVSADSFRHYKTGESVPFSQREFLSSDYLFSVSVPTHSEKYIYLRVSTSEALILPMAIGTEHAVFTSDKYKDIFWGMYIGLMVAMLLYNCFVYFTTKDKSYLYYILYVLTVVVTQITLSGYGFQLLWPDYLSVAKYSAFFNPALAGIAAIGFARHFLKTKTFIPKSDKLFPAIIASYFAGAILCVFGHYSVGMTIIDITAGLLSLSLLVVGISISARGYRPAVFFVIAWIVFLIGVFIFVFKNFGLLPYNNFTVYTMPVGSAMEVLLLSFALADRINILKKETEVAQEKELLALQENERLTREQNIVLERRVRERTNELKLSNDWLNKTLSELKEAQIQLVESEKMASLGQLTAGIAHEINNPINFVTANIKPLNRDIDILMETIVEMERIIKKASSVNEKEKMVLDYKNEIEFDYLKTEIEQSLNGIREGASRTTEIVKGLRVFSRLDESERKKADINEGLNSTLVITNNLLNNVIELHKNFGNLPHVVCYPGKLNQVFLNVISNAIHAIKQKFGEKHGGQLTVSTAAEKGSIIVRIRDNGTGMSQDTRKKIFEPFFTTKDVGEGIGLGLSISFNTIKQHNGHIHVNSELGSGTEFIIELPITEQ